MDGHTYDTIRNALHFIPAHDRELWVRTGMAIKSALGDGGFDLWDEWSQRDESYNERDARTVWKSINANGRVTIATLYHEAKRYGFEFTGENCPQSPTPEEVKARRCIAAERAAKEEARERAEAAKKAGTIWKAAVPVPEDHPYLTRKGIKAHGLRTYHGALIVPMRDGRELHSLQFISTDGEKRFLPGGRMSGCYFPIGKPDGVLCIAEGYATAASIHEATGHAVAVAFNAGNLGAVAEAVRAKFPDIRLILCADDDYRTEGNPGLAAATEAALTVSGLLAVPDFGENLPEGASDFNDLAAHRGPEAVRAAIANAKAPISDEPQPGAENATAGDSVAYRRISDIEATPIHWLWPGRIARGKITILAGHPGLGKSQVTMSMAAIVSTGGQWPVDRTPCEQGSVIILSAEDDPEDTIRPRLEAAGAGLQQCYILDAVCEHRADGLVRRTLNLAIDIERLGGLARKLGGAALVVIDPVTAYLGDVDSHKNAEVRGLLAPLATMAAECGTAVVCVSHLTKAGGTEAMLRVMGSLGFVAAARAAYLVAKDPDDDRRRLFLPMKNNIAKHTGGLAFRVVGRDLGGGIVTSCVEWDAEPVTMTADEAMTLPGDPEERSDLEAAKQFLRGLLADGPVPSKQVKADADGAGHAWRTIRRAADSMGVLREKSGMKGGWVWKMPSKVSKSSEDVQVNSVDTFG